MTLRLKHLVGGVIACTGLYALLLYLPQVPPVMLNSVSFTYAVLLPGTLLYSLLAPKKLPSWIILALIVCLSLLSLMLTGLLINAVLPLVGVLNPLGELPVRLSLFGLVGLLMLLTILKYRRRKVSVTLARPRLNRGEWYILLAPLVLVTLSVLGAISLNNRGSSFLTLGMLCLCVVYVLSLILLTKPTRSFLLAYGLSGVALALLLSTSLRGWYTVGHDIQREFYVFQLAKQASHWSMAAYQDAYNTCLSITILPTYLSRLLHIGDAYIYKIFFQIVFAITAGVVFSISSRYVRRPVAVLATIWYISFPTFFNDMPMLNRQELAFLFFAVLIWFLFDNRLNRNLRRGLLGALALGVILSHYSTTYSVIAIFGFTLVFRWLLELTVRIRRRGRKEANRKPVQINLLRNKSVKGPKVKYLSWSFVLCITLASFCWTVLITDTGGGVSRTLEETYSVVVNGTKGDSRSADVAYGLFRRAPDFNPQQRLDTYVSERRANIPQYNEVDYYSSTITNAYPLTIASEEKSPLTPWGKFVHEKWGVPVKQMNGLLRQLAIRLLQVSIILGFLYIFVKLTFLQRHPDVEFYSLSAAMIFFVVLQIVLPVLSAQYGLLRAFQQALIVVGMYVVVGIVPLIPKVKLQFKLALVVVLTLVCMISTTGVLTGLLGGYTAQLNLSNAGDYYDNYYVHDSEVAASRWLITHSDGAQVHLDDDTFQKLNNIVPLDRGGDIMPSLVSRNSYVLLGYRNTHHRQAQFNFNGDNMTYSYPTKFLDDQKDLLYTNGSSRMYR